MIELLIRNPLIVDGTGGTPYRADIAIGDGRIIGIEQESITCDAPVIDADGLMAIPGFIDPHSHADTGLFTPEFRNQRIVQGITTDIVGHCGPTPAPNSAGRMEDLQRIYYRLTGTGAAFPWNWTSMDGYLRAVTDSHPSSNLAFLVGHGTLRAMVMGMENRPSTRAEQEQMQELLRESLRQGAIGLSTGLSYPPGCYARTDELTALAKVCKEYNGIICCHRRSEGQTAVESVREMLDITRETGVRMQISHLKTIGRANWGKSRQMMADIEAARMEGLDVQFDVYPYTAGYTQLSSLFPEEILAGGAQRMIERLADAGERALAARRMRASGIDSNYHHAGPEGVVVIQCADPALVNRSLADIAAERSISPEECAVAIVSEHGDDTMVLVFMQDEQELTSIISHPLATVMSDGAPSFRNTHPRYMGTFARILDHYTKRTGALRLEDAVRKCTAQTAERFRIKDRGVVRAGAWADILLLHWETFRDNSTYENPYALADGLRYVLLSGKTAARDGVYLGTDNGRVLRRRDCNPWIE